MKHHRSFVIAAAFAGLATAACFGSHVLRLIASPDVPAADATAKITAGDNGNTKIDLSVHHLALPGRVDPSATVYVVWARGDEANRRSQNLGALRVDGDLNGSFSGVTPLKNFALYVTPESSQQVTEPRGRTVLSTNVSMR